MSSDQGDDAVASESVEDSEFAAAKAALWGPLDRDVGPLRVRQPEGDVEQARHFRAVDSSYGFPTGDLDATTRARIAAQLPERNRHIVEEQMADGSWRVLGGAMRYDMDLSLPGNGWVGVAGLTAVGIDPAAQGRGGFRALIEAHLRQARDRGDAASVLMASEVRLYGRFGYGCATQTAGWEIDVKQADLMPGAPTSGRVHVEHGRGEALQGVLNDVWMLAGSRRAGSTTRKPAWWDVVMGKKEHWLGGGNLLVALHTDDAGRTDGYALYTVDIEKGRQGIAESEVKIRELVALDAAAELDLWRFIVNLPWGRTIRWDFAPIDPAPLFWLRDHRQLRRMAHHDFLWVRPLDMGGLVENRSFAADGVVRLQVTDPLFADLAGRFDLVVDGSAGEWVPGTGEAEATVDIADLGAAWLGGASLAQRCAVGLIPGDPHPLRRLDAMLRTDQPPRAMSRF